MGRLILVFYIHLQVYLFFLSSRRLMNYYLTVVLTKVSTIPAVTQATVTFLTVESAISLVDELDNSASVTYRFSLPELILHFKLIFGNRVSVHFMPKVIINRQVNEFQGTESMVPNGRE